MSEVELTEGAKTYLETCMVSLNDGGLENALAQERSRIKDELNQAISDVDIARAVELTKELAQFNDSALSRLKAEFLESAPLWVKVNGFDHESLRVLGLPEDVVVKVTSGDASRWTDENRALTDKLLKETGSFTIADVAAKFPQLSDDRVRRMIARLYDQGVLKRAKAPYRGRHKKHSNRPYLYRVVHC